MKSVLNFKKMIILMGCILLIACEDERFDKAYAKIISPSDNATFKNNDTIIFITEGKRSGVLLEFDECKLKVYNMRTAKLEIDESYLDYDTVYFFPSVVDTTMYLVSAEYWREDAKSPERANQIKIKVTP